MPTPLTWSDFVRFVDRRAREHPEEFAEMHIQPSRPPGAIAIAGADAEKLLKPLIETVLELKNRVARLEDRLAVAEGEVEQLRRRIRP